MSFFNQMNTLWTGPMEDMHKELWASGMSASAIRNTINEKFKMNFTRNAIIGKAVRLNLPKRDSKIFVQHRYTDQQLNLIRARAAKGETQKQIAAAIFAKYGVDVSENSIGAVMRRNKIRGNERRHGMGRTAFAKRPTIAAKKSRGNGGRGYWYEPFESAKKLTRDDPIAEIGFSIVDLRANGCRFPVARTPETLVRRFCGDARMMDDGKFISAYCPKHHITTHRQQPVCEAAE